MAAAYQRVSVLLQRQQLVAATLETPPHSPAAYVKMVPVGLLHYREEGEHEEVSLILILFYILLFS
jgi:hypothetical protein